MDLGFSIAIKKWDPPKSLDRELRLWGENLLSFARDILPQLEAAFGVKVSFWSTVGDCTEGRSGSPWVMPQCQVSLATPKLIAHPSVGPGRSYQVDSNVANVGVGYVYLQLDFLHCARPMDGNEA